MASRMPIGLCWNSETSSCAYDALFTIMYSMWTDNQSPTYLQYAEHNVYWNRLHTSFQEVAAGRIGLDKARDRTRQLLHEANRRNFPVNC
jgi:hypothetical protein